MFTHELKRPRSPVPWILAITTLIGLAAVLLTPVPRQVRSTYKLEPSGSLELKASRGGVIASVGPEGRWVEKGAAVVTFDNAPLEAKQKELEAQAKAADARLKAASAPGRNVARLKDAVAKAELAEKQAKAAVEKAKGPARAIAEKKAAAAEVATKKAREALESPEEVKAALAKLEEQLAQVRADLAAPALLAPSGGVLTSLAVKQGEEIAAGALVARLDDTSTLKVILQVPKGETLKSGQTVDLTVGKARKRVQLEQVSGETAVAQLGNSSHELKAGTDGVADITGEPRSIIGGL